MQHDTHNRLLYYLKSLQNKDSMHHFMEEFVRTGIHTQTSVNDKKKFVLLINGFKLDGTSAHIKAYRDMAILGQPYADVHICVGNINVTGCYSDMLRQDMESAIYNELQDLDIPDTGIHVHVLADRRSLLEPPSRLIERIDNLFDSVDLLFTASGFHRPWFVEKTFLRKTKRAYFYKMGSHNANEYLQNYDGIMSAQPQVEALPQGYAGDILLRPASIDPEHLVREQAHKQLENEQHVVEFLGRLKHRKTLVTASNKLTAWLEPDYIWIINKLAKKFGDISLLLIGGDSVQAGSLIQRHCPVDIHCLPYTKNLFRLFNLISEATCPIFIYPNHSGAGYTKRIASFFMPTFIFSISDSVCLSRNTLCLCKEEIFIKTSNVFNGTTAPKTIIDSNSFSRSQFHEYSSSLIKEILTGGI